MPPPPINVASPSGSLNWWQSIILAGLSALAGVIAVVVVQSGVGVGAAQPSILFRYIPHFLLLFGVLADAFTYQGVYWTGTFAGVMGAVSGYGFDMILSFVMRILNSAFARAGSAPPAAPPPPVAIPPSGAYDGCNISGETKTTVAVPPTLTMTASVFWFYVIDLIDNLGWTSSLGTIVAFLTLYAIQAVSISKCMISPSTGPVWGLIYGLLTAGAIYAIFKSSAPQYLPSSVATTLRSGGSSGGGSGGGGSGGGGSGGGVGGGQTQSGGYRRDDTSGSGRAPTGCSR